MEVQKLSGLSRHLHLAFRGQRMRLNHKPLVRRVVAANPSVRPIILPSLTLQRTQCSHWRQAPVVSCPRTSRVAAHLSPRIGRARPNGSPPSVSSNVVVLNPIRHGNSKQQCVPSQAIAEPPRHSEVLSPAALVALLAAETPGTSNGAPPATSSEIRRRELGRFCER